MEKKTVDRDANLFVNGPRRAYRLEQKRSIDPGGGGALGPGESTISTSEEESEVETNGSPGSRRPSQDWGSEGRPEATGNDPCSKDDPQRVGGGASANAIGGGWKKNPWWRERGREVLNTAQLTEIAVLKQSSEGQKKGVRLHRRERADIGKKGHQTKKPGSSAAHESATDNGRHRRAGGGAGGGERNGKKFLESLNSRGKWAEITPKAGKGGMEALVTQWGGRRGRNFPNYCDGRGNLLVIGAASRTSVRKRTRREPRGVLNCVCGEGHGPDIGTGQRKGKGKKTHEVYDVLQQTTGKRSADDARPGIKTFPRTCKP